MNDHVTSQGSVTRLVLGLCSLGAPWDPLQSLVREFCPEGAVWPSANGAALLPAVKINTFINSSNFVECKQDEAAILSTPVALPILRSRRQDTTGRVGWYCCAEQTTGGQGYGKRPSDTQPVLLSRKPSGQPMGREG